MLRFKKVPVRRSIPDLHGWVLSILYSCLFFGSLYAQTPWKERYNKDGLIIHTRQIREEKINEYKSITTMAAGIDRCVALLQDVDAHPEFLYRVEQVEVIKPADDQAPCFRYVINFPFPMSDRDLILQTRMESNSVTAETVYHFESTPDKAPRTDKIRITLLEGYWRLRPLGSTSTLVETYGRSTISGLPSWLVNLFLHHTPKATMQDFKRMLEENE